MSVIIPVYNSEKYLKQCLNSIVNQTYKNLEIIVVNDGSTDNSTKIINEFKNMDKRIKLINKVNSGQASSRNLALKESKGDYITFVDSDDYIETNMIESMLMIAKKNSYDIVVCGMNYIKNTVITEAKVYNKICNNESINFILSDPGPCAKLFKHTILNESKFEFLEGRIYEDLAVIPSLGLYTDKIEYIDKCLYNYRIHSQSTMNDKEYNNKLDDIFYSLENLSNLFKGQYPEELQFIYIKRLLHDASLRYVKYNNKQSLKSLKKISQIMKNNYSDWNKNKYLFLLSKKDIIIAKLFYHRLYFIYRMYRRVFK